jgi:hypothetical protein
MTATGRADVRQDQVVCPSRGAGLAPAAGEWTCVGCGRAFPVVAGIPDLRITHRGPYVSREEDIRRARELEESRRSHRAEARGRVPRAVA